MNITEKLTDSRVSLANGRDLHLLDLSSTDTVLGWSEELGWTQATLTDIEIKMSSEVYVFQAGDLQVTLSPEQGFWLKGGGEIKAADVVVNSTQVWVRNGDGIESRTIDSLARVKGGFITYDVIGSSLRNYVVNGFVLHNFDVEDYRIPNIIGEFNQESSADDWSDMYSTARATRDAYLKAINELIFASTARAVRWTDTALQADILATIETDLGAAIETMWIKQARFFNSLVAPGDQYSGVATAGNPGAGIRTQYLGWSETVWTPNFSYAELIDGPYNFDVDYTGSNTFSPFLYQEHQQAMKDLQAALKRVAAKLMDIRIPENNYKGVTPPYGFADPITLP